jgi:arsenate reductase
LLQIVKNSRKAILPENDKKKLKILFLCTGNSCRSQMAEGWTQYLKGDQIEVWSAGVEIHGLNPYAVRVMAEAGVDISSYRSKHVREVMDIPFDFVITVCDHARESCPIFQGPVTKIHKQFDDPPSLAEKAGSEDEKMDIYRRVRDEIRAFVEILPESLDRVYPE